MRRIIITLGCLLLSVLLLACGHSEDKTNGSDKSSLITATPNKPTTTITTLTSSQPSGKLTPTKEPVITKKPVQPIDTEKEGEAVETVNQHKENFYYEKISDSVKTRIVGKSYGANCDVPFEDLRYVSVLYIGFDGETHKGELIVNRAIAADTVDIFKELYEKQYPIERMVLVDEYDADDNTSMAADNSSSFNYRNVDGTKHLSLHSYGLAIDINPRYNPYVRGTGDDRIITPLNGIEYADRSLECSYYIKKDDICYQAFIKRGFTWGGEWNNSKDYQHFQKSVK
jgi:hypothetical protein